MIGMFVDTSAWFAIYNRTDAFHRKAVEMLESLKEEKVDLYTSKVIFAELIALEASRYGKKEAIELGSTLLSLKSDLFIEEMLFEDELKAWELFKNTSAKVSYVDCTCVVMMKRLEIEKMFTFDKHFGRMGVEVVG
jgi:predicted nucleic acid-binding protein